MSLLVCICASLESGTRLAARVCKCPGRGNVLATRPEAFLRNRAVLPRLEEFSVFFLCVVVSYFMRASHSVLGLVVIRVSALGVV